MLSVRFALFSLLLLPVAVAAVPARAEAPQLQLDQQLIVDAALLAAGVTGLDFDDLVQSGGGTGAKRKPATSAPASDNQPLIQPGSGLGIGLQIGTPTAVTVKFPTGGAEIVLGIGAGYAFRSRGFLGLSIHGDYLLTVANLTQTPDFGVTAYLGPGLWLTLFTGGYGYLGPGAGYYYTFNDFIGLGARFPLGVNAKFNTAPVELYLELDPALFVFPGLDIFLGASLGFRWFF